MKQKPKTIKLLAVGLALINDHEALEAGISRYIGRKWDSNLHGFPAVGPSEVKPLPEYVQAVQRGELAPADQATADYCGVPFAPPIEAEVSPVPSNPPYDGRF